MGVEDEKAERQQEFRDHILKKKNNGELTE